MPASDPGYYRRRYQEDAGYRAAVVAATQRWQDRQRTADPGAWAERVARDASAARSGCMRERYRSDPEFRERLREAQRRRRAGARAAASGPPAAEGPPPPPLPPADATGGAVAGADGDS